MIYILFQVCLFVCLFLFDQAESVLLRGAATPSPWPPPGSQLLQADQGYPLGRKHFFLQLHIGPGFMWYPWCEFRRERVGSNVSLPIHATPDDTRHAAMQNMQPDNSEYYVLLYEVCCLRLTICNSVSLTKHPPKHDQGDLKKRRLGRGKWPRACDDIVNPPHEAELRI